jgi:hypothetical protein
MTSQPPPKTTLTEALRLASASIRSERISEGFERAVARRIDASAASKRGTSARGFLMGLGVVLAATAAVTLAHVVTEPGLARIERQRELVVAPPVDETTWVEIDLLTGHHGAEHVLFHVEVPAGILVALSEKRRRRAELTEAGCDATTCRFVVAHPPGGVVGSPIQIGLSEPGDFFLRVTHHSSRARVREDIDVVTRD